MISKTHKGVPLLQIDNLHTPECGAPPTLGAAEKFVSYFENRFGEQWVLVGDRASGKAVVYAGDCHWQKPMEVSVDQPYPRATLQEPEKMFVAAGERTIRNRAAAWRTWACCTPGDSCVAATTILSRQHDARLCE
jgi:hypothetical protein